MCCCSLDPGWVFMRLFDIDGGCRIEMAEVPTSPPLSRLPGRLALAAALPRNRECTWRLAALAERPRPDDVD